MKRTLLAAAIITLVAGGAALAQTTANVNISANVAANCTITTNSNVAFGGYDPLVGNATTPLDAQGELSVSCTKGASGVTIALSLGSHASGAARRMVGGTTGEFLGYELYSDATHSTVWNATTLVTLADFSSKDTPRTATIYGRIPQAQDVSVDGYSDVVVATLDF